MSVDVVTFGCRLNIAESEVIRRAAGAAGLDDAVVVNTCAVTAEAVRQARQTIRRHQARAARGAHRGHRLRGADRAGHLRGMPEVDRVIGNEEKLDPRMWAGDDRRIAVGDIMAVKRHAAARGRQHRGPHARLRAGAERLRPSLHVLHHSVRARQFALAADGRGAWRRRGGWPSAAIANSCSPASISPATAPILPARRGSARWSSAFSRTCPNWRGCGCPRSNSVEADADLLDALANEPRLMPHLHLSLQAGDDLILKRMKRRHTRADAIAFCEQVRRLRPDVVFGADIIAGFPTETEDMFARSLDLVDECGLTQLHVFPFSPRPGTPAARMPQVDRDDRQGTRPRVARKGRGGVARASRRASRPPAAAC